MQIANPFQDKDFAEYQIQAGKAKAIEKIDDQIIYVYSLFKNYTILYTNKKHTSLNQLAKKHKAIYTIIENTKISDSTHPTKHKIREIIPRHTTVINLTQNEESILEKMHQKGRYNIRVAKKHKLKIQESNDIDSFYEILESTAKRDNFNINPKKFYQEMVTTLKPKQKLKLFLAYHPDYPKAISGILNTYIDNTASYYYGASDHKHRKFMAPYLLQWHAILDAKKLNFTNYDFLGVADPTNKKDALKGVTNFKNKFGGLHIKYEDAQTIVHKPLLYSLLKVKKLIT